MQLDVFESTEVVKSVLFMSDLAVLNASRLCAVTHKAKLKKTSAKTSDQVFHQNPPKKKILRFSLYVELINATFVPGSKSIL